jgi:hypothetical protein
VSALDDTDPTGLKMHPSPGQTAAREEVKRLLSQLKLPVNERARRREWFSQVGKPLQSDELFTAWPLSISELTLLAIGFHGLSVVKPRESLEPAPEGKPFV